jgi:predicted  nucleic acid-binding Zn-ribbon protein
MLRAMSERRLRQVLDELHAQLERSETVDPETRALLRSARSEIEDALDAHPEAQARASSARTQLGQAVARFEGEHPDAVALVQRVLDALTHIGV